MPGVGDASLFGSEYALRVWLDPSKLHPYSLTVGDVENAITAQNVQVSTGVLGGLPAVTGQRIDAAIIGPSRMNSPEGFEAILIVEFARNFPPHRAWPGAGHAVQVPSMASLQTSAPPARPMRKGWIVVILGLLTATAPFATDMFLSGIPAVAQSFGTDVGQAQLALSVFFFGLAVGQCFYGPIIDRYGRRRPLLFGSMLFTVTSCLEVMATDLTWFLALRFLQALGGCAGMVIGRAVVLDLFGGQEAARVFSLLMLVQGIGPILAPVLGGAILSVASWRMILVFLTIFGLACTILVARCFAETLDPANRQDIRLGHVGGIMKRLAATPGFIVPTLSGGIATAAMFVFISGSPFVFINLYGVSPGGYSLLFALNAVGMIAAGQCNAWLLKRFRVMTLLKAALAADCAITALLLFLAGDAPLPLFAAVLFTGLALLPIVGANSTALAMSASRAVAGNASTFIGVIQFALAALNSTLVSLLHDGTSFPMAGLIFCSVLLGAVVQFIGSAKVGRQARG